MIYDDDAYRCFCMPIDCLWPVSQPDYINYVFKYANMIEQEKEYKMCLDAYNEKSNEKATLVNRLMEVCTF